MTLKEVTSSSDFSKEIGKKGLTVAKYYTTWCGPCKQIAPFVEQLATKYPNVNFIQIDGDKSEIVHERGVKAFPTFQFYVAGQMVDSQQGGDPNGLESKIIRYKVDAVDSFAGKGNTLASDPTASSVNNATALREARLKALQSSMPPLRSGAEATLTSSSTSALQKSILNHDSGVMDVDDEADDDLSKAIAISTQEAKSGSSSASSSAVAAKIEAAAEQEKRDIAEAEAEQLLEDQQWGDEMVPVPVDADLLKELVEMGFSDVRARKGLVHGLTLEGALQWITDNENDPNIDQPYMVKKSDTMPKPVLTEEEKAKKLLEVKEKIRLRKQEKVKMEKEMDIKREKERREQGKSLTEIQDERDRLMRKREGEKQKKEKMDAEKERQRLRAEIAHDKEMRKLNKGVLPSVLGVDGYNPSAVQYDSKQQTGAGTEIVSADGKSGPAPPKPVAAAVAAAPAKSKSLNTSASSAAASMAGLSRVERGQKIDAAIQTLMKYRTAGDGGNALKLLLTFVKNVNDNPQEMKYRSINTESSAFKSKLSSLIGPVIILRALGFQADDEGKLKLEGCCRDVDLELVASTTQKLTTAEATYRQMNPT